MDEIKLALIGMGRFADQHIRCYRQMNGVRITAICDVDAARSERAAAELGCGGYTDWRRLLDEERPDAVVILTPEALHAEPALMALSKGIHVFVEKPVAVEIHEAEQMAEAAEKSGKLLMVGHVCRFDPRYIRAKECFRQGQMGRLRSIYARRNNGKKYFPLYRRTHPLFILGIHDIDLMLWMTESRPEEVIAWNPPNDEGDTDLVWGMIRFADGTVGVLENNWLLPDKAPTEMDVRMEIVGDRGTIHLQEPDQSMALWGNHDSATPPLISGNDIYGVPTGPLMEELRHFMDCVRLNAPSDRLRTRDAVEAVRTASALLESARTGRPVRL